MTNTTKLDAAIRANKAIDEAAWNAATAVRPKVVVVTKPAGPQPKVLTGLSDGIHPDRIDMLQLMRK